MTRICKEEIESIDRTKHEMEISKKRFAEAQRIAKLGSWEWEIQTGVIRWSDELFVIYGLKPESFTPTMTSFAKFIHPDDQDDVNRII